jgi:hypothetical protein
VIDGDMAERHELAQDVAPLGIVDIGTDTENAELLMIPAGDPLVGTTAQHVDDMHRTEALPRAVDCG